MTRTTAVLLLLTALVASSCRSRTYLLVTVEVAPEVAATITELQFTSSLELGSSAISTDERHFSEEGPLRFPKSFVLLADRRGAAGETAQVFVEAYDATGATVARGRSGAEVVAGEETSLRLTLRPHCSAVDDCLGGQAFCDNPHACNCVGDDCARGFCEKIDLDDGNSCTQTICNEAERTATHEAYDDGTSCVNGEGEEFQCASGICKAAVCGDFIVDPGEECDEGAFINSDTNPLSCRSDCRLPTCGDAVVDDGIAFGFAFIEECDEGLDNVVIADNETAVADEPNPERDESCRQSVTLDSGEGETLYCVAPFCGDGRLNAAERCDDHNQRAGDACNSTCTLLGEVKTVAGKLGGAGHYDGVGSQARRADVLDIAVDGEFAYFTADGLDAEGFQAGHDHTIRGVSLATGEVTTLAGAVAETGRADGVGTEARFDTPIGMALEGDHLYIADRDNHSIRRLDLSSNEVETIAGTGSAGSDDGDFSTAQFNEPTFLAMRSSEELIVFDNATCRVRQVDFVAGEVTTIVSSEDPFGGDNSCAPFGDLGQAGGIVMGNEPFLYVSDEQAIHEVDLSDGTVTLIAGGEQSPGLADGPAFDARFREPAGLVFNQNELIIADRANDRLRRLDLQASEVTTITPEPVVGQPRALGLVGQTLLVGDRSNHVIWEGEVDGTAEIALSPLAGIPSPEEAETLPNPLGLTTLAGFPGFLYVADGSTPRIQRIVLDEREVSDLVVFPEPTTRSIDVAAVGDRLLAMTKGDGLQLLELSMGAADTVDEQTAYELAGAGSPVGLSILGSHAYVSDRSRQQILGAPLESLDATEVVTGTGGGSAIVDGSLDDARFIAPAGAVACGGRLYVSETFEGIGSHVVREIDVSAGFVSTIAGFPTTRGHQDAADASERSLFDQPRALACDERDSARPILYVADEGNHVIRQIELDTGRVSTLAGSPGQAVSIDGHGSAARFSTPRGIYFDPVSGDLYVSDVGEGVIRRIR